MESRSIQVSYKTFKSRHLPTNHVFTNNFTEMDFPDLSRYRGVPEYDALQAINKWNREAQLGVVSPAWMYWLEWEG
jgi:hypothetical protein